jgi:DNA-binding CsgD family transcriptional regulator
MTVRFHLRNIYDKAGVHTRGEAVHWAMQHEMGEKPSLNDR